MSDHTRASRRADDRLRFDISTDAPVERNLGRGDDVVRIRADEATPQVRLTFTSAEVGDRDPRDSGDLANQDGGFAVRAQAEDATGALIGSVSRFDDEGIRFVGRGDLTFDVRDLVSGVERGDMFDVVQLGTRGRDRVNERGESDAYYINGGRGRDVLTGGGGDDFLVGGGGDDRLEGRKGDDSFIGGSGGDRIYGREGDDVATITLETDGADQVDLGRGSDTVNVVAPVEAGQVRLTFTSAEVGNRDPRDSETMANQDGRLAVRLQAEDGTGELDGAVSRFDDEGVTFVSATPGVTFDVRDLVSGTERGDQFEIVRLGTRGRDRISERDEEEAYYINAGMGRDRVNGGLAEDFLVGGLGRDKLNGREGDDSMIGGDGSDRFVFSEGPGNDRVIDFVSGEDTIDLRAFGIGFDDVEITDAGRNVVLGVEDFEITLVRADAPVESDFLFV